MAHILHPEVSILSYKTRFFCCGTNVDPLSRAQKCKLVQTKKYTPGWSSIDAKYIKKLSQAPLMAQISRPEVSILSYKTRFLGCGTNFDPLSRAQKWKLVQTKKYTPGGSSIDAKYTQKLS